MRRILLVVCLLFTLASMATAGRYFADITGVDANKGTVEYTVTHGAKFNTEFKARITKDCVIKNGYYRLGKPAVTKEDNDIENGLKNPVFKNTSMKTPLRVNIYTADDDDAGNGIKKGDIVKILVNPVFKKKKK